MSEPPSSPVYCPPSPGYDPSSYCQQESLKRTAEEDLEISENEEKRSKTEESRKEKEQIILVLVSEEDANMSLFLKIPLNMPQKLFAILRDADKKAAANIRKHKNYKSSGLSDIIDDHCLKPGMTMTTLGEFSSDGFYASTKEEIIKIYHVFGY
jgi:hypothetical protein